MSNSSDFSIKSEYSPKGDQPKAIEGLVSSINADNQYQTLLGATGTGKSLGYDDPVFVVQQQGYREISRVLPIGQLIDSLLETNPEQICQQNDTEVLDSSVPEDEYYAQSFNPETGRTALYKIRSFIRHEAPAQMYRLETACGRSASLTGDHNLWVLRDGALKLIKTTEALTSDYVPLPEQLFNASNSAQDQLESIDTTDILKQHHPYIDASEALLAYAHDHGKRSLRDAAQQSGIAPSIWRGKMFAMQHQVKNRSLATDQFSQLLETTPALASYLETYPSSVGLGSYQNNLPAQQPVSPTLLRTLGLYIAEGHKQSRYIVLSNHNSQIRQQLETDLRTLGIQFTIRPDSDYQISSRTLTALFSTLCGQHSRDKQLPEFWPQLSKHSLGELLQAYFDGDGTVENWSAVTATTASQKLASDLTYALMSFGIWARISKKWKQATNSDHAGDWYYQVSASGQENLEKFSQFIGFSIDYKQAASAKQQQKQAHSNVDVVAINGEQLRSLRQSLNISAKTLGQLSGLSRSAIQLFELEQRRPRRTVLKRILDALRQTAQAATVSPAWWQGWKAMEQLTHLRWTAIASLTPIDYPHSHVYDFCVPGAETFLGGDGGFFVHNTFTMANVIKETGKPTLVLAHNKTLAAQLCNELRGFFPDNAVEYFISYYDYYQPEAYIPVSDTYIAKTSSINEEIDMLRHSATRSLFERKDVIVVASISCIYGLGIPSEYLKASVRFKLGQEVEMRKVIRDLVNIQYTRNDLDVDRGRFRLKGDVLEVGPAYEDRLIRIEFFGDEIDAIRYIDPVTGEILQSMNSVNVYPARHFVTPKERLEKAIKDIKLELEQQLEFLQKEGKLLEAQRLEQRTKYDLEMLQEVGYCQGVENYSRHLAGRLPGAPPECLLDYFPAEDWLLMVDESHVTVPQLRGMYNGDQARKKVLIDHGFRLPSAADNRPLKADEFWAKVNNCIFVSATPGQWELEQSDAEFEGEDKKAKKATKSKAAEKMTKKRYKRGTGRVVEQVIRPTGVIDPEIFVRPTDGQVDDLLDEIQKRSAKDERVLVTTLTKRMAEDLTDYFFERGVKVRYMHSEINSIERIEIIRDLREGTFDVLIGVNLLREGLDLPEVSLVAILDADKEGFLRAERSLIQTIGRAARHIEGKAILYADNMTDSMLNAISETERRREIQMAYNEEHGIIPTVVKKKVDNSILAFLEVSRRLNAQEIEVACENMDDIPLTEIPELIKQLEDEMKKAAAELEFEKAGEFRDRIKNLRNKLVGKS